MECEREVIYSVSEDMASENRCFYAITFERNRETDSSSASVACANTGGKETEDGRFWQRQREKDGSLKWPER